MKVSFSTHFSYVGQYSISKGRLSEYDSQLSVLNGFENHASASSKRSEDIKKLLRDLKVKKEDNQNPLQVTDKSSLDSLLGTATSSKSTDKSSTVKKYKYNPMAVSNLILKAKTSLSAANAMRQATRKVNEVRKKIASKEGDSDELELALSHALRMEQTARKKKHNLEQEEMVERTQKLDEKEDKIKEGFEDMNLQMVSLAEDEVASAQDDIFDARDEAVIDVAETLSQSPELMQSELTDDIYEQISQMGDELLDELEDEMENLEEMEILDPHMSKEELDKVKLKHRLAEEKEIMKANLEYLKSSMKLIQVHSGHGNSTYGSYANTSSGSSTGAFFSVAVGATEVGTPAPEQVSSVDVSA